MKTILKIIARVALVLVAALVVVGATVALAPVNQVAGNGNPGPRGNRPAQGQTTGQAVDQNSTGSATANGSANAQAAGVPPTDGGHDREGAGGAAAWGVLTRNLAEVGVIVLPFAAVGILRRRRKTIPASA